MHRALIMRLLKYFCLPVVIFALLYLILNFWETDIIKAFQSFVLLLNLNIGKIIIGILGFTLLEQDVFYILQIDGKEAFYVGYKIVGLRYYFIALLIICFCVKNEKNILKYILGYIGIINLFSILFIVLRAIYPLFITEYIYSLIFESAIVLSLMYLPVRHMINKYNTSDYIDITEKNQCSGLTTYQICQKYKLYHHVFIFLFLLLIFVFVRFNKPVEGVGRLNLFITNLIIYPAKAFLELLGYSPEIYNRDIKGDNAWIFIGIPCLGKRIMLVFSVFILIFKGNFFNKIIYVFAGLWVIILLNALRISFLYMYLDKHGSIYYRNYNLHEVYNYVVYAAVVAMWFVYLKFFSKKQFLFNR